MQLRGDFHFIMDLGDGSAGAVGLLRHRNPFDALNSHQVRLALVVELVPRDLCHLVIDFIISAHMIEFLFNLRRCLWSFVHFWFLKFKN